MNQITQDDKDFYANNQFSKSKIFSHENNLNSASAEKNGLQANLAVGEENLIQIDDFNSFHFVPN